MIENAVRERLLAVPAVTALAGDRVRPDQLAESDTLPAIILEEKNERHPSHMAGGAGIAAAELLVSCVAATKKEAETLAEAVRSGLSGYRGTVGGETIRCAILRSVLTDWFAEEEGSDRGQFESRMNFTIWRVVA